MCAANTTKVGVIAHHASGARGLAAALARALIDNQVEIKMDNPLKTAARLPAHVREKKAWNARKKAQKALVAKHGNFVTKPRVQQYLAASNGPAPDPQPMTRQVARQNQRRALKALLSDQKAGALKAGIKGGPATILSAEVS